RSVGPQDSGHGQTVHAPDRRAHTRRSGADEREDVHVSVFKSEEQRNEVMQVIIDALKAATGQTEPMPGHLKKMAQRLAKNCGEMQHEQLASLAAAAVTMCAHYKHA